MISDFNKLTERKEYHRGGGRSNVPHHGVKITSSIIRFLTRTLDDFDSAQTVIYIGEIDHCGLKHVLELFPRVKFVIIDQSNQVMDADDVVYLQTGQAISTTHVRKLTQSNEITREFVRVYAHEDVSGQVDTRSERVFVIQTVFTQAVLERVARVKDPLLIYNRRKASHITSDWCTDYDVCNDAALCYNAIKTLRPRAYMVRFRCPWPITDATIAYFNNDHSQSACIECADIDFVGNFNARKFVFLRADAIWLVPFGGRASTETVLVGRGDILLELTEYDLLDYERKMAYFNDVHRQRVEVPVGLPVGLPVDTHAGKAMRYVRKNNDWALAVHIMSCYNAKYAPPGLGPTAEQRVCALFDLF